MLITIIRFLLLYGTPVLVYYLEGDAILSIKVWAFVFLSYTLDNYMYIRKLDLSLAQLRSLKREAKNVRR